MTGSPRQPLDHPSASAPAIDHIHLLGRVLRRPDIGHRLALIRLSELTRRPVECFPAGDQIAVLECFFLARPHGQSAARRFLHRLASSPAVCRNLPRSFLDLLPNAFPLDQDDPADPFRLLFWHACT